MWTAVTVIVVFLISLTMGSYIGAAASMLGKVLFGVTLVGAATYMIRNTYHNHHPHIPQH